MPITSNGDASSKHNWLFSTQWKQLNNMAFLIIYDNTRQQIRRGKIDN